MPLGALKRHRGIRARVDHSATLAATALRYLMHPAQLVFISRRGIGDTDIDAHRTRRLWNRKTGLIAKPNDGFLEFAQFQRAQKLGHLYQRHTALSANCSFPFISLADCRMLSGKPPSPCAVVLRALMLKRQSQFFTIPI
jgi:hypothetical protein